MPCLASVGFYLLSTVRTGALACCYHWLLLKLVRNSHASVVLCGFLGMVAVAHAIVLRSVAVAHAIVLRSAAVAHAIVLRSAAAAHAIVLCSAAVVRAIVCCSAAADRAIVRCSSAVARAIVLRSAEVDVAYYHPSLMVICRSSLVLLVAS